MKHVKPFKNCLTSARAAFSLIEIMVAMTILTVIVLIVSGIFQQTSTAWSIGMAKSSAQASSRAIIGAITRDLAMAVDPLNFSIVKAGTDTAQSTNELDQITISANSISFNILNDDLDPLVKFSEEQPRGVAKVEYSTSSREVKRTETSYAWPDGGTTKTKDSTYPLGDNASIKFAEVTVENVLAGVELEVDTGTPISINNYEIAVGSAGPDRQWGTDDDIRSWPENEDSK